ncbi:hypothetical protein MGYG_00185 [Nannizzia gypsea CBS 118893]|uniref:Uncharacterized protein n=1 Tax=Arthroderma gypseum (strain ATCC MYA-4604 / CBS 118893) TaxID=535722 RepID=E5R3L8_ARTGP|nr:hypothetical protein MGYG_00185 [Nannizzia gypsea CBS 118893]EFQ97142.1 hypothetical protein MGYG_00185 [Nannizzia gypsea CBS 118893]
MPVVWNDAARAKLLMAILKTSAGKIDYKAIVEFMGPEYNAKSIQNQIQSIKSKAFGDKPPGSNPSTPSKGRKNDTSTAGKTPTKSPASAKRGRDQTDDGTESASECATPTNSRRSKKVKAEVKEEIKSEDLTAL